MNARINELTVSSATGSDASARSPHQEPSLTALFRELYMGAYTEEWTAERKRRNLRLPRNRLERSLGLFVRRHKSLMLLLSQIEGGLFFGSSVSAVISAFALSVMVLMGAGAMTAKMAAIAFLSASAMFLVLGFAVEPYIKRLELLDIAKWVREEASITSERLPKRIRERINLARLTAERMGMGDELRIFNESLFDEERGCWSRSGLIFFRVRDSEYCVYEW